MVASHVVEHRWSPPSLPNCPDSGVYLGEFKTRTASPIVLGTPVLSKSRHGRTCYWLSGRCDEVIQSRP